MYASTTEKEKFQQFTECGQRSIIGLREGGYSFRAIAVFVLRNSSTVIGILKQWTDEHTKFRKSASGQRKVLSERDDRHLI